MCATDLSWLRDAHAVAIASLQSARTVIGVNLHDLNVKLVEVSTLLLEDTIGPGAILEKGISR
jgi:hypothetical protein